MKVGLEKRYSLSVNRFGMRVLYVVDEFEVLTDLNAEKSQRRCARRTAEHR
jgi:hypothetical protein